MATLNKEAVGQYNYVTAEDTLKRPPKLPQNDIRNDASVDLVKYPKNLQLFKLEPPKMFESAYHSDFRHPPKENLVAHKIDESQKYSQYRQRIKVRSASTKPAAKEAPKPDMVNEYVTRRNRVLKSLLDKTMPTLPPRAQTAQPALTRKAGPTMQDERKTADFQRAIVQGRPEWKHKESKSYDILNPEKLNQFRETNPYGAPMENMQETVAQKYMEDDDYSIRSSSSFSLLSDRIFADSRPQTMQSARISRRSRTAFSDNASNTGETPFLALGTIQEEGLDEENAEMPTRPTAGRGSRRSLYSAPEKRTIMKIQKGVKPDRQMGKIKAKPVNLYEKKLPDKKFYKPHRMRQTPNEMNQFKKMRNRTFFKPLEQAIHEKDFVEHEIKYQPERQLLQDARWQIRQDLKDVRTKNINSLVDRFAQRAELKKEEKRGRLGLPIYAGRDPVSIYKLRDTIPERNQPRTDIQVQLPVRRRITPSIGSVQRARNLSTYANIWNQPAAPPDWGPQKVDHRLFLPPMAINT